MGVPREHLPPPALADDQHLQGTSQGWQARKKTDVLQQPRRSRTQRKPLPSVSVPSSALPVPAPPQAGREEGAPCGLLIKRAPALLNHPELGSAGGSAVNNVKLHPPPVFS